MRPLVGALLILGMSWAAGADAAPAGDAKTGKNATAKKGSQSRSVQLRQLDNETVWTFEPLIGRIDTFYDRESLIASELAIKQAMEAETREAATQTQYNPNADLLAYANGELGRIETLMAAKKYDDSIHIADSATKRLTKNADVAEIQAVITRIAAFREQADEALTRNEAQALFDNQGLKVEGILWSEGGSRLAILSGETRAIGINDRVKDCVVINIATDRVDFRFHHKHRRFEFPRYVGEDSKASAVSAAAR